MASWPLSLAAQQPSLPQQIADEFIQLNGGVQQGYRLAHAKGLVCTGTFTPASGAHVISRAAHLRGPGVPVTVPFSEGAGLPRIPDTDPNSSPHGMAIRFALPAGAFTDIVADQHNGFMVGTGEDFLAFLRAIAATTPASPHPNPVEQFLGGHPAAAKFVAETKALPASFATLDYYGDNAFLFVDSAGTKRAGRYQILPVAGIAHLEGAARAQATPDYMFADLQRRIAKGPVQYTLWLQLANPGDQTNDASLVWPADRKRVELGTISVTAVAPDNAELQRSLTFDPIYLTNGIELSDDPLVSLRSAVYALSVQHRR